MKKFHNISFAKQLTYYLLSALIITFALISIALSSTLDQFIHNSAYDQARSITTNVLFLFDKQIVYIENIPNNIAGLSEKITNKNATEMPCKILKSYPFLSGCTIHYNPDHPDLRLIGKIYAVRHKNGKIANSPLVTSSDLFHPDTNAIIKRCQSDNYWIKTENKQQSTLSLCTKLYDEKNRILGILKIDFPLKMITDLLCDYKLFRSGLLFIIDNNGRYIAHPDSLQTQYLAINSTPENVNIIKGMAKGETMYTTITNNGKKNYLYVTPIPQTEWRIGIVCPYNEIMPSSRKLYIILIISLGFGSLFLFICTVNIVHRLAAPLKQLAYTTRQMAKGRFDVSLSTNPSCSEIQELYSSFQQMRQHLVKYIDRLTITTAEKEALNSEMRLARRIQQSFLPSTIQLPANVDLCAELHQSREVGGDLFEYFINDYRLYFVIGDVAGKGIPAALYMASIVKFFRYVASDKHSTAEICNIINKNSCAESEDDIYITMFMGIIDINTGILTFTNAGHPYPLIVHENGEVSVLNKYPEVPIGVLEDHEYKEHIYTLHKNSSILLYTDGITDAEDKRSVFYGNSQLMECIKSVPLPKTPELIIKSILKDVYHHMEGCNQSDDQTILSILYKGIPGKHNNRING